MHDKVPYDIFVTENADNRHRHLSQHKTNNQPKESLSCMDDLQKGQQVIIICKSTVKRHTRWTGIVYEKFVSQKLNLYQKDRRECAIKREFRTSWRTVKSDSSAGKLRTNQQLVIERIR